eukprot:1150335-Pelagomonas_calceolata.AAC.1
MRGLLGLPVPSRMTSIVYRSQGAPRTDPQETSVTGLQKVPLWHCHSRASGQKCVQDPVLTSIPGILRVGHYIYYDEQISAMNGLHHPLGFQQEMRSAIPLDLHQLLVDLRSRHLAH